MKLATNLDEVVLSSRMTISVGVSENHDDGEKESSKAHSDK